MPGSNDPAVNARQYKNNDIDSNGDGQVNDADTVDGQHASQLGTFWTVESDSYYSGVSSISENLSTTYDTVKVIIGGLDSTGHSGKTVDMTVNGLASGYTAYYNDATSQTALGAWPLANLSSDTPGLSAEVILNGGSRDNHISAGATVATEHGGDIMETGEATNASSSLSSLTINVSNESLWGRVVVLGK